MSPRALLGTMRLHAAALATLVLLAPAAFLWPGGEGGRLGVLAGQGPLDEPSSAPPSLGRFDATYRLNDTRLRPPTMPDWPTEEGCILLQSAGITTIAAGGLYVTWSAAGLTGSQILTLRVEAPRRDVVEVTGASPMELRLDGLVLHEGEPARVSLRANDRAPLVVHQEADVRMGWDMTGAPMTAERGCGG